MTRALQLLDRILFTAIALLLATMVVDVTIQVFFRYIVQDPPTWTEELARYLFAWEIFLAAAVAFGRASHIVVDVLLMALPAVGKRVLLFISNLFVLFFLVILTWQGINMTVITANTVSTAMQLNMAYVYASLPTGAAIGIIYTVAHLIELLRGTPPALSAAPTTMVD